MNRLTLNATFHALLTALEKTKEQKQSMVEQVSTHRTSSSKHLTDAELGRLVYRLKDEQKQQQENPNSPRQRMIRTLYFCARQLGWFAPDGKGGVKVDANRLNNWCRKYTAAHEPLLRMSDAQLAQALTAMKKMVETDTERIAK